MRTDEILLYKDSDLNEVIDRKPHWIKGNKGNSVPREYPMTAPIPPHVAADAGPNKIHVPSADATKLVVKDNVPTFLLATK